MNQMSACANTGLHNRGSHLIITKTLMSSQVFFVDAMFLGCSKVCFIFIFIRNELTILLFFYHVKHKFNSIRTFFWLTHKLEQMFKNSHQFVCKFVGQILH